VKPAPFVYHSPDSVGAAVDVLSQVGHDGKILAGGQSLIPILNMRLASPAHLVDINRVAGLDGIDIAETGEVRIGALVRHAQLEKSEAAYAANPLLRRALRNVAHPAIRNRGTTVGSIAHADAAGEMPAILAITRGVVETAGPSGSALVDVADFFQGPLETSLAADEMVVAVTFRPFPPDTGTAFTESARRHGDYALAGVATAVTVLDGMVESAHASFVSVTDVPAVLDLTQIFAGRSVETVTWDDAVDPVREFIDPQDDIHATAEYRRVLAAELTLRSLRTATVTAVRRPGEADQTGSEQFHEHSRTSRSIDR
jgi:aerobic carbon-monoxide dehydrogenase medium subunit